MYINTFYPQHPVLKKYIHYYYFLKAASPDFQTIYYAFPNINIPVSLHRSAVYEIKKNYTGIQAIRNGQPASLLQRSFQEPLLVSLQGPIDKVTIVFKPFGISSFINRPFGEIAPADSQVFQAWGHLDHYRQLQTRFFSTDDHAEKIILLEDFLLSVYAPTAVSTQMERAIGLLSDFEEQHSIEEIAKKLGLTPRSFHRLFLKHMSISPVAWKKIARFRQSMENKLFKAQFKKLTQIGYDSNFYDQSYFIKVYNQLTGSKPTSFFKSIDKLADDRLIVRFVKE